ncbi:MAG: plasma membrane fusion protein prm1 [Geoglossum umbratile]|nr:MAG: plasma membrane fusion protein prm1 [Geoglossum umbratile]
MSSPPPRPERLTPARSEHFPATPSYYPPNDNYEMQDWENRNSAPPPPPPSTTTGPTPYLGLQARLSQVWINRWTILLLLVLVRALIAIGSLNSDLASARREALQACSSVEDMGSTMASLPHYMSQGVNELTAKGVEKAVNGLMSMILLSVTAIEEIVLFVIHLLTSTYLCLITLVIRGSLGVAISVAKEVTEFLNKALGDISGEIVNDVKSFQDGINKFIGGVTSLGGLLGGDKKPPTIDITSATDKLKNIQLPADLNKDLDKLNSSLPTFDEVQDFLDKGIKFPFEELKKLINSSLVGYTFDRSVFPVPQREQLSFCSDGDGIDSFFDGLLEVAIIARKVFIIVILILAALACIPMAYREIRRWRTINQRAQLVQQQAHDPLDVIQIASRPYTSGFGIKLASRFDSPRTQILVRWFVAYATTTAALFILSLALAGLLSCLFQFILLKSVEKEAPALANQVGNFTGKVMMALNNASTQWAVGTNKVIASTNDDINKELFGWVNTSTTAVNNTLNDFVDKVTDELNKIFGGTILYDPIKEVFNCLIGIKIAGIEKGLTWIHDNAHIDFPRLPDDTFTLGAAASLASNNKQKADSFLADPGSKTTDKITSALDRVIEKFADGIRTEAIISSVILVIWFIIVLIGFIRAFIVSRGHDKVRGDGGETAFPNANRESVAEKNSAISSPRISSIDEDRLPPSSPGQAEPRSAGFENEKLGWAGHRNAPAVGISHQRTSSSGFMTNAL